VRTRRMLVMLAALSLAVTACGESLEESTGGDTGGGGSTETEAAGGGGDMPIEECRDEEVELPAGDEPLDGATITVGSKDFDEQLILGNIAKTALESAGVTVEDQINLGGTNPTRQALLSNEIDTYWSYTGTAWISFFGQSEPIPDRQEQYLAVKRCDWVNNEIAWTEPTPFNNTYGLAFRSEAAEDLGNPQTISDLGTMLEENPEQVSLCVETEFNTRNDGLPGLEEHYGFDIPDGQVSVLDTGVVYSATDRGDPCNFGEVFTTDGRIAALDLTVLEDDKGFFPLYNVAPVFTAEVFEKHGAALRELFNPISAALTQETMTELNKRVSADGEAPATVAKDFLESNDLLAS
jgi:osmoprotectant transport system substrate-binding protein